MRGSSSSTKDLFSQQISEKMIFYPLIVGAVNSIRQGIHFTVLLNSLHICKP